MSYLDSTIPADTEGVKLGASRIRALAAALNTIIAKIFDDSGNFLTKWVTGAAIANDATVDGNRAISSNHLQNGAVIARVLADGILTADATGQAKMADGFLTADTAGRAKMADSYITLAKLAWSNFFNGGGSSLTKTTPIGADLILIGDSENGYAPRQITLSQAKGAGLFISAEQALSTSTLINLPHGLSATPTRVRWVLVCKTANAGYAVGDELSVAQAADSNNNFALTVEGASATNVFLVIGGHSFLMHDKATFALTALTSADWKLKCYASL